jgi:hypothetical protein
LTLSPEQQTVVDASTTPVKPLLDLPQIAEAIEKGVNTFMEDVPPLMEQLDEVVKVHPYVSGASSRL